MRACTGCFRSAQALTYRWYAIVLGEKKIAATSRNRAAGSILLRKIKLLSETGNPIGARIRCIFIFSRIGILFHVCSLESEILRKKLERIFLWERKTVSKSIGYAVTRASPSLAQLRDRKTHREWEFENRENSFIFIPWYLCEAQLTHTVTSPFFFFSPLFFSTHRYVRGARWIAHCHGSVGLYQPLYKAESFPAKV